MRLYAGKISPICQEIINNLTSQGDLEVEDQDEAILDLEAVLKEYVRQEKGLTDEAKSRMEKRGMSYSMLGKVRSQLAKEKNLPQSEDVLPYLLEQLLNMLFHSQNIAEIYADDAALRKEMTKILKKHMEVEEELDQEVRSKIKNLKEGTASFEIEYQRVLDQIKRKKGLST